MRTVTLRPEDYQPHTPAKRDYGISVVGCGGIANGAHLPAYQKFGYRVLACCDIRPEAVEATMQKHGIPKGGTDIRVVLDDPEIQIVDLAVHASQRPPLVAQIAEAGKHILSQKPFAMNMADAQKMVETAERAGVTLMVNQQARWAPIHRAMKLVVDSGVLGHIYSVLHVLRSFQDVEGSWYVALENFNIIDHGIHYIDLSRYFTGRTPVRVKATTTMMPGQHAVSPMIYTILGEYDTDLMTTLHFNNIVQAPGLRGQTWHIDGTDGSLTVTSSTLEVCLRESPDEKQVIQVHGSWFPDAFGGSMGELMQALSDGREPQTSGRDNLNSLGVACAAVESSRTGRAVELSG
ncbi:MAG: Gfo/Idh/MocA family oxidoreductase [Candidatus Latescibacteria bacterium]|nr:Gfo/Idh/MocA family oxidoreductase [Candidatus Latescibacterota bacterium]